MEARRGWVLHVQYPGGFVASSTDGLRVIVTLEQWAGAPSRHVSVSRADRHPTWEELHHVKRWVFGDRCEVVQILPPEEEYVNGHPHCFHLHGPIDSALRWGLRRSDLGPEAVAIVAPAREVCHDGCGDLGTEGQSMGGTAPSGGRPGVLTEAERREGSGTK